MASTADQAAELMNAVLRRDLPSLEQLLRQGRRPDSINNAGVNALHLASNLGRAEFAAALLRAGADPSLSTASSCLSPLHLAADAGSKAVTDELLNCQADVNAQQSQGYSALHLAALNNHFQVARSLIAAQADVDARQEFGATPLYLAVEKGHDRLASLLLSSGANPDLAKITGESPIYIAAESGHVKLTKALTAAGADTNAQQQQGASPLYIAAQNGHSEVVKLLIDTCTVDVDLQMFNGESPLHIAAENGQQRVVEALIGACADVDLASETGSTPLYIAAQNGHNQVLRSLLSAQAQVDLPKLTGESPLLAAAQNGLQHTVKILVDAGADVNQQQYQGFAALHVAAQEGFVEVAAELLRARANVSLASQDGFTAIDLAVHNGQRQVADILAKAESESSNLKVQIDLLESLCLRGEVGQARDILEALAAASIEEPLMLALKPESSFLPAIVECIRLLKSQPSETLPPTNAECLEPNYAPRSLQLHDSLVSSGFHEVQAAVQGATANVLQHIIRQRSKETTTFIVGSFSEGWGNSLVRQNGKTDPDSDIDVTSFYPGRMLHIRGLCRCEEAADEDVVDYENGHVKFSGATSNPSKAELGSFARPAIDNVTVYRCCCYPAIKMLEEGFPTCVPDQVLQALKVEVARSMCHLATAAPPGHEGSFLRLSTTFLENRLMRSLTTVQGQLFLSLKFIIKKVIGKRITGLKTYHAKTLIFYMVEETPHDDWQPSNLLQLARKSLEKLREGLLSDSSETSECMRHFFLRDAIVYLKGGSNEKREVAEVIRETMERLPQLFEQFRSTLKPLKSPDSFYFHPFLIIPDLWQLLPVSPAGELDYHEIYDMIRVLLLNLQDDEDEEDCSLQSFDADLDRLPDCARTAREGLRVMRLLKLGRVDDAVAVLLNYKGQTVSRGIHLPNGLTADEATPELVWRHLTGSDSAWKFYFNIPGFIEFFEGVKLDFLPEKLREFFPIRIRNYMSYYLANFDILMKALFLELLPDEINAEACFDAIVQDEDADSQEVAMVMYYATDSDCLVRLVQSHDKLINSETALKQKLEDLLEERTCLKEMACERTLKALKCQITSLH